MTNSIFTRYLATFMLIITVAFSILCLVLGSNMSYTTFNEKKETVEQISQTISGVITRLVAPGSPENVKDELLESNWRLGEYITLMSDFDTDMMVFIVDTNGAVILTNNGLESGIIKGGVPADIMSTLSAGEEYSGYDDLGGALSSQYLYCAVPVYSSDGETVICSVFTCASSSNIRAMVANTMKILIMASLWVFLAALVAVYFITERITSPLKSMSRAAKSFSGGQFDIRVPVSGRDEVAELAIAFNQMADSLQNLEEMRRGFLANVSHDLKTPMTTIAGFIDAILVGAIPPEQQNEYLERIKNEVLRLSRLVRQLLDLSRVQAGERKFEYSDFDVCEMARQILFSFEQKIDQKHLEVEFDCDSDNMWVYSDKDAIHQILYNICDNAVKFSKDGGALKLSVHLAKDKKTAVSVYNEGVGIPEEDIPFVFERFYKSDKSRGLDKSGVGLGLYISKTIIGALGEDIWVESEHGRFCRFTFTLPPSAPEALAQKH